MTKQPRLAVLIDAENVSHKLAESIFEEITKFGRPTIRRIYGDFSTTQLNGWNKILSDFAISAEQNFANSPGKNASDMALAIDAMDILHSGLIDGICIISSDADFTRLANRITEQGIFVYGFGEQKTPKSLIKACQRFVYLENIKKNTSNDNCAPDTPKAIFEVTSIIPKLRKSFHQLETEDGRAMLGQVGTKLREFESDFDARNYGYAKLSDLIEKTNYYKVEKEKSGGGAYIVRIKPKDGSSSKSKNATA